MHDSLDPMRHATLTRRVIQGFILLAAAIQSDGELFSISDTSYPHVFMNDPVRIPLVWHRKFFAFRFVEGDKARPLTARLA